MGSSALHLDRSRYQLHVIYKRLHNPCLLYTSNQQSDEARVTGFDDDEEQTVLNIRTKPDMRQGTRCV